MAIGAAGAHTLEGHIDSGALDTLETAVRFQMYHGIALAGLGVTAKVWRSGVVTLAAVLMAVGTVIFCGSLYLLALLGVGVFWSGGSRRRIEPDSWLGSVSHRSGDRTDSVCRVGQWTARPVRLRNSIGSANREVLLCRAYHDREANPIDANGLVEHPGARLHSNDSGALLHQVAR